jgi:predicted MFS family arabinose efflux permease
LILADVHGGLKPFLTVYLASVHRWDPARIGMAMAVTGLGGALSNLVTGIIVQAAGFDTGFLVLAAIAPMFFACAMPETGRPTHPLADGSAKTALSVSPGT